MFLAYCHTILIEIGGGLAILFAYFGSLSLSCFLFGGVGGWWRCFLAASFLAELSFLIIKDDVYVMVV